jgi:hypothetical protein
MMPAEGDGEERFLKDDMSPQKSGMTSGSTASTMHSGYALNWMASASDKSPEKARTHGHI